MAELVLQIPVVAERSPAPRASSQLPAREALDGSKRAPEAAKEPDQQENADGGRVQAKDAVADINKALAAKSISLRFSVDEATNRVVVKVTDRDTGVVIRQIPPEVQLRVAGHIREFLGILLNKEA